MTDEEKVEALDGYFAEEGEEVTAMRKFGPLTLFNVGKTVNTEEGKSAQELLEEINRITGDYSIYTDELDLNGHMQADIAAEILNVKMQMKSEAIPFMMRSIRTAIWEKSILMKNVFWILEALQARSSLETK